MPEAPNPAIPLSRLVRWLALGAVIVVAIALYFRNGRHVEPVGAGETAAPAEPAPPPAH